MRHPGIPGLPGTTRAQEVITGQLLPGCLNGSDGLAGRILRDEGGHPGLAGSVAVSPVRRMSRPRSSSAAPS